MCFFLLSIYSLLTVQLYIFPWKTAGFSPSCWDRFRSKLCSLNHYLMFTYHAKLNTRNSLTWTNLINRACLVFTSNLPISILFLIFHPELKAGFKKWKGLILTKIKKRFGSACNQWPGYFSLTSHTNSSHSRYKTKSNI